MEPQKQNIAASSCSSPDLFAISLHIVSSSFLTSSSGHSHESTKIMAPTTHFDLKTRHSLNFQPVVDHRHHDRANVEVGEALRKLNLRLDHIYENHECRKKAPSQTSKQYLTGSALRFGSVSPLRMACIGALPTLKQWSGKPQFSNHHIYRVQYSPMHDSANLIMSRVMRDSRLERSPGWLVHCGKDIFPSANLSRFLFVRH